MRYLILLILISILVIPISYALTASIGNARMILRPEVNEGQSTIIDKSILVKNVNNISVKVNLDADENYKKIVEIFDNELILQPGESKNAKFRITLTSGGDYEGNILVTFFPEDENLKESPVGLISKIIIIASGPVTDDYYLIMGEQANQEEEEENIVNDTEENNEGVSVSIGGSTNQTRNNQNTKLIGILIIVGIFVLAAGMFFIIKRSSK